MNNSLFVIDADNEHGLKINSDYSRYEYEPLDDITVHELALVIGVMLNGYHTIGSLPQNAKRHFKTKHGDGYE